MDHTAPAGHAQPAPVTLRTLRRMTREGTPFACLTAYDATTARWLERAGVHLLLAGDSAAEVILGLPSTLHMPLDFSVAITAAVKRGAPNTVVMADMPFMSYHAGDDDAMRNAGRFMTEGTADIVKIEADASFAPLVRRMTAAGIPVCGHVGYRPQTVKLTGGPRAEGRTESSAERLVDDALALEDAGAVMLLIEAVPPQTASRIVERAGVPVIGIGAGPSCHGQILVIQDLLGMTDNRPAFAPSLAQLGPAIREAGAEWVSRVARRAVTDHRYELKTAPLEPIER